MPPSHPASLLAFACLLHVVAGDSSRDAFHGMRESPTAFRTAASRATRSRLVPDRPGSKTQDAKDIQLKKNFEQQQIKNIKQHILGHLGMEKAPKIPWNVTAALNPSIVSNFYSNDSHASLPRKSLPQPPTHRPVSKHALALPPSSTNPDTTLETPKERQIIHVEPVSLGLDRHTLEFRLHAPPGENHRVTEANLRIMVCYKKRDKSRKNPGRKVKIKLFQIPEDTDEEERIATVISMVRHTKWQRLLLPTTLVQGIMDSSTRTLKVKVVCVDCGKDIVLVLSPKGKRHPRSNHRKKLTRRRAHQSKGKQRRGKPGAPADRTPYLEIHTANKYRRLRRDVSGDESMVEIIPGCCQLNSYVNFEEFGWHTWILFPRGFNQTFCIGGCAAPPASDTGATEAPPVCCKPMQTSSLPVIYLNTEGEINRAEIPNLITHQCGCP